MSWPGAPFPAADACFEPFAPLPPQLIASNATNAVVRRSRDRLPCRAAVVFPGATGRAEAFISESHASTSSAPGSTTPRRVSHRLGTISGGVVLRVVVVGLLFVFDVDQRAARAAIDLRGHLLPETQVEID